MRQRRRRFDDTTEHLRDTAVRLLLQHGARSLTLESLSEQGFASVGSVYERWGSRASLIADLVATRFEGAWAALAEGAPRHLLGRLERLMNASSGETVGVWLVELMHVARDVPELRCHAHDALERLAQWCPVGGGVASADITERGAQGWMLANVIGHAQLRLGGARMPNLAAAVARLASAPEPASSPARPLPTSPNDLPSAGLSDQPVLDDVARHLVGVTRRLIAEAGGETSVRAVLAEAGVAAGSLYRRFDSKRALLLGVLESELASASYEWVQGLMEATRSDDPIGRLAWVFRQRFETLYADAETRQVILELTAQARTDEVLRRTVVAQVEYVAAVRAAFFERFAAVGVVTRDVTPEMCGWLVQAPAAGYRLMVGAGVPLDADELEAGIARVFWNILSL